MDLLLLQVGLIANVKLHFCMNITASKVPQCQVSGLLLEFLVHPNPNLIYQKINERAGFLKTFLIICNSFDNLSNEGGVPCRTF